jgi:hypothetical protein
VRFAGALRQRSRVAECCAVPAQMWAG